jgi:hypothetical protein
MSESGSKSQGCSEQEQVDQPGMFFRTFIEGVQPGRILLPADGDKHNAVLAAELGWEVDVFDFCLSARRKAIELARRGITGFEHFTQTIEFHELEDEMYDVIALINVGFESHNRSYIHKKLIDSLKSGGFFLIEVCADHDDINNKKKADTNEPYEISEIKSDFSSLEIETLNKQKAVMPGKQSIFLRMVASKP